MNRPDVGGPHPPYDTVMGEWSWEAAFHGSVHTATLAVATVLALFVLLLGSFGNGLVLLSALRRRKVRTNFDLLLLNLSTADLLLCVLLAPLYLYTLFADPPSPRIFCGSLLFGGTGCGLLSLLSIVAVAIHRQARVVGRAKRSLTSRQTGLVLGVVWALSGAGALGATLHAMLDWRDDAYHNCQVLIYSRDPLLHRFTLFFLGPVVLVSFVVIIVSYAVIARAVRAQSRARTQGLAAIYRSAPIYRNTALLPAGGAGKPLAADPALDKTVSSKQQTEVLAADRTLISKQNTTDSLLGQDRAFSAKQTDPLVSADSKVLNSKQTEPLVQKNNSRRTAKRKKGRKSNSTAAASSEGGPVRPCHCCSCQAALERENKAVTMCMVVILTLVLCWSPLLVSQFVELATGPSIIILQVKLCGIALVFLNSALDPYMYAQNQGRYSRTRYGRLFWDVLRCQCANAHGGTTRFRTLRTRPVMGGGGVGGGGGGGGGGAGGGPPKSSLLEVDTPTCPLPPPPPQPPEKAGLVAAEEGNRGACLDGFPCGEENCVKDKCVCGDSEAARLATSRQGNDASAPSPGPDTVSPRTLMTVSGQHGGGCVPPVSVLDGLAGNWGTVLDQQTATPCVNANSNTAAAATNTVVGSHFRHTCRTKDVMRDVKTLMHKSCCHAGHVPSDQSLVES